jgi:Putative transposase
MRVGPSEPETLSTIAAGPQHLGAEIGFFAVLHSWGHNLLFQWRWGCVVPGGGISLDGATRWISCRPRFFLPVRVLSRLFLRRIAFWLGTGDTAGRPSWRSSLTGDPGAGFFCGKPQHMKNSLNFANTCLKVVDTRCGVLSRPCQGSS